MARVLVVDDEKLIVKGIRFSLEQDGYEVDCAYDGDEAIERAKEREYDVVLLDVMLPGHDGFEVCQTIREFSEMPIIMLTAKGDDMDKILSSFKSPSVTTLDFWRFAAPLFLLFLRMIALIRAFTSRILNGFVI